MRPFSSSLKHTMALGLFSLLATGCVAQQADLAKIQKDLELQISKIQEEKRALGAQVEAAKSAITESKALLDQQKEEIAKMQVDLAPRTDFAGLNQQVKLMREQDLAMLHGKNEEVEKRLGDLEHALHERAEILHADIRSVQTSVQSHGDRLQGHDEHLQQVQAQTTALAEEVDTNSHALTK